MQLNQPCSIEHNGRHYTITLLAKQTYRFDAFNRTLDNHAPDMDLEYEFEDNAVAWAQYIDDAMLEAGIIVYSDVLECYCPAELKDEWEQEAETEARTEAEHIRQESRSDIFI